MNYTIYKCLQQFRPPCECGGYFWLQQCSISVVPWSALRRWVQGVVGSKHSLARRSTHTSETTLNGTRVMRGIDSHKGEVDLRRQVWRRSGRDLTLNGTKVIEALTLTEGKLMNRVPVDREGLVLSAGPVRFVLVYVQQQYSRASPPLECCFPVSLDDLFFSFKKQYNISYKSCWSLYVSCLLCLLAMSVVADLNYTTTRRKKKQATFFIR